MNLKFFRVFLVLALCGISIYANAQSAIPPSGQTLPLLFMENKGQIQDFEHHPRPDILFMMRDRGVNVFVGKGEIHYLFSSPLQVQRESKGLERAGTTKTVNEIDPDQRDTTPKMYQTYRIDLSLTGMNPNATVEALEKDPYYENYYNIPGHYQEGILNVHSFGKVRMNNVYPGIDWILYSKNGKLKHEFVLHPGSDPAQIKLKISGATDLLVNEQGELLLQSPLGTIVEDKPVIPEDKNLDCNFTFRKTKELEYEVGYAISGLSQITKDITIDPGVVWSTFYGGIANDEGRGTATDKNYIYFGGNTGSHADISYNGFQNKIGGNDDWFIVKMTHQGNREWSTYFGGAEQEHFLTLSVSEEHILAGGYTYSKYIGFNGFDTSKGSILSEHSLFMLLRKDGTRKWSSYYGSDASQQRCNVVTGVVYKNAVVIAGMTQNTSGIASSNALQKTIGGSDDAFVAFFDTNCVRKWGTYFGKELPEIINGALMDSMYNIYLVGMTKSKAGLTKKAYQDSGKGDYDGMLLKLDSSSRLIWSTLIGGPGREDFRDIDIYKDKIIIGGRTNSTKDFATSGAMQKTYSGLYDGCFAKFDTTGKFYWCTYFGSVLTDDLNALKFDLNGNLWTMMAGGKQSDFNKYAIFDKLSTSEYLTIHVFDSSMKQIYGTNYSGNINLPEQRTATSAISLNNKNEIYTISYQDVYGNSAIRSKHQEYNNGNSGSIDALLVKWSLDNFNKPIVFSPTLKCQGTTLKYTYSQWAVGRGKTAKTYIQLSDTNGIFNSKTQTIYTRNDTLSVVDSLTWNIPINFTPGKNYRIRAIMNSPSDTSEASEPFEILRSPTGKLLPVSSNQICDNDSLLLELDTLGPNKARWYYKNAPTPNAGDTTRFFNAKLVGRHDVLLTAPNGCTIRTNFISLTVYKQPTAGFYVSDTAQCFAGNNFTFNDTSKAAAGDAINNQLWYFGDGANSILSQPVYNYSQPGKYLVKLGIGTTKGCIDTAYQWIHVLPEPILNPKTSSKIQCLRSNSFTFTDSSSAGKDSIVKSFWKYGNDTLSKLKQFNYSFNNSGFKTIKLIVESNNGCKGNASLEVEVSDNPYSSIQASKSGFCAGDSVKLEVTNPNTFNYQWLKNGITIANQTKTLWFTQKSGAYTVRTTNLDGCDSVSNEIIITAYNSPKPNLGADRILEYDSTAVLNPGSFKTYQWKPSNTNSTLNVGKTNLDTGKNTISVLVTDSNGCKAADTVVITLKAFINGLKQLNLSGIKVFPVPASKILIVELSQSLMSNNKKYNYELFDLNGRLCSNGTMDSRTEINIQHLSSGEYLLRIKDGQEIFDVKILKE